MKYHKLEKTTSGRNTSRLQQQTQTTEKYKRKI